MLRVMSSRHRKNAVRFNDQSVDEFHWPTKAEGVAMFVRKPCGLMGILATIAYDLVVDDVIHRSHFKAA